MNKKEKMNFVRWMFWNYVVPLVSGMAITYVLIRYVVLS